MVERDELLAEAVATIVDHLDQVSPWRRDALCREYPDLDWHGRFTELERAVCARCTVRADCLGVGLADETLRRSGGLWGGLDVRERARFVRAGLGPDDVIAGRTPPPGRARTPAKKPKAKRVACDECGGLLPPGRVGLCCGCQTSAAA